MARLDDANFDRLSHEALGVSVVSTLRGREQLRAGVLDLRRGRSESNICRRRRDDADK